jgi:hypothetical protein
MDDTNQLSIPSEQYDRFLTNIRKTKTKTSWIYLNNIQRKKLYYDDTINRPYFIWNTLIRVYLTTD